MVIIIEVKVSMGEKEIMVIIIKKLIIEICTLKLNLFKLVACVSYHRVYKQKSKLIAIYLTIL